MLRGEAFRRMNRRVSRLVAGWRTGLSRPVLILQAGNAFNYFGYGLILPFEIIYLHQIRGFSTSDSRTWFCTGDHGDRPPTRHPADVERCAFRPVLRQS